MEAQEDNTIEKPPSDIACQNEESHPPAPESDPSEAVSIPVEAVPIPVETKPLSLIDLILLNRQAAYNELLEKDPQQLHDCIDPVTGDTALHVAVQRQKITLAQKLITLGADVNKRNKAGSTPLHKACLCVQSQWFIELLLEAKAEYACNGAILLIVSPGRFVENQSGISPVDYARNDRVLWKWLLSRQADHVRDTFYIADAQLGALIGRQGHSLDGILRHYGVDVDVPAKVNGKRELVPNTACLKIECTARKQEHVTRAKQFIERLPCGTGHVSLSSEPIADLAEASDGQSNASSTWGSTSASSNAQHVAPIKREAVEIDYEKHFLFSSTMAVPKELHAVVLGKGKANQADLEFRTGTKIIVPKKNEPDTNITIQGDPIKVEKAKEEIRKFLAGNKSRDSSLFPYKKEFHLDPEQCSAIIGKGGAIAARIRETYNVSLKIPTLEDKKKPNQPQQQQQQTQAVNSNVSTGAKGGPNNKSQPSPTSNSNNKNQQQQGKDKSIKPAADPNMVVVKGQSEESVNAAIVEIYSLLEQAEKGGRGPRGERGARAGGASNNSNRDGYNQSRGGNDLPYYPQRSAEKGGSDGGNRRQQQQGEKKERSDSNASANATEGVMNNESADNATEEHSNTNEPAEKSSESANNQTNSSASGSPNNNNANRNNNNRNNSNNNNSNRSNNSRGASGNSNNNGNRQNQPRERNQNRERRNDRDESEAPKTPQKPKDFRLPDLQGNHFPTL